MKIDLDTLYTMLTYMRPAGSNAEKAFINRFIRPFKPEEDNYGNLYIVVGENPNVMFTSHTDTVHRKSGAQKLEVSPDGWVFAPYSDCLGADCTVGVYVMLRMIKADVPGLYAFFREEECGGGGSNFAAKKTPERFKDIDACISFDRKGFTSIITHQFMDRCCSEKFATSLGSILDGSWVSDDGGSFTDSANFTDIIGECTNLSVGYLKQHTKDESTNVLFLEALINSLIKADWDQLQYSRLPGESDWGGGGRYYGGGGGYTVIPKRSQYAFEDLVQAINDYPEIAAQMLQDRGYTSYDIITEAYKNAPASHYEGDDSHHDPLSLADLFPEDGCEPLMEEERITG